MGFSLSGREWQHSVPSAALCVRPSRPELGQAIAEFLTQAPSAEAVSKLGRRIDPTSRL
jgi:hypothetical protein